MKLRLLAIAAVLLALPTFKAAADVDLVTVPTRESTQLTIYNSEDLTMVREHRLLTVKRGINRIQFSWANTLIDPTSIDFRILDHQDQVDLVDTTFPSGRTDALQWNIRSEIDGKLPVEIRYFTSGITWQADYVGIADEAETRLDLTGYVRVMNNSGELYDKAQIRLVVGKINLVERIIDLARRPPPTKGPPVSGIDEEKESKNELRKKLANKAEGYEYFKRRGGLQHGMVVEKSKDVAKSGLSEYFLFTISGREDIKNAEPKRLVALDAAGVPLECLYKLTDRDGGKQITKFYRFKNVKITDDEGVEKELPSMENLGLSPLPDGSVRLFSQYANKDLAYVGGTSTKYVPIGDRVEVNVGADTDITIARRLKDQQIANVIARQYKRRIDDEYVMLYDLIDYDETFEFTEEIVSGKPVDVKVEIERRFDANVILWANDEKPEGWDADDEGAYVDLRNVPGRVERIDQNHVKFFLDLKPAEKQTVKYSVTYKRRKIQPELNQVKKREPI